ncbi:low temperature requirement protein A [Longispora albida]|uniref:low temperature requirement protein A n=1 Tax=Longispora albida TaxID=203523 RepID=UPI0012FC1402|nr:low temperature requirement protein A [Longispora albida]
MSTQEAAQARHAVWIELFFDLVFVVTVSQLAHHLEGDPGPREFGDFLLLFAAPWWAWLKFSSWSNVAGTADGGGARYRLEMLAAMATVAVMGAAIPDALGDRGAVYALGYAATCALIAVMWLLGRRGQQGARPVRVILFNAIPCAVWVGSIWLPAHDRPYVWLGALAYEVLLLIFVQSRSDVRYELSHIVERVGLFVIIVLGESIVSAIRALNEHWSAHGWVSFGFGLAWIAALWWAYFDFGAAAIERELSGTIGQLRDIFALGHFPIVTSLTAMAAGLGTAVAEPEHLPAGAAVAMCGGLAVYRICFAVLAVRAGRSWGEVLRWAVPAVLVAAVTLALAIAGYVPGWAVVALLAAEAAGQLLRGIHRIRSAAAKA